MTVHELNLNESLTPDEQEAEAQALAQGEEIARMLAEDEALEMAAAEADAEPEPELIAGKFKSQEEVVKAYLELEKKMGQLSEEHGEEAKEPQEEAAEGDADDEADAEPEAVDAAVELIQSFEGEFAENGKLSNEAVAKLTELDPAALVEGYMKYMGSKQQQALEATEIQGIQALAGGAEQYAELVGWAAENLAKAEVAAFNEVTANGHVPSIRFAVKALKRQYEDANGKAPAKAYRGKKAASSGLKPYASHDEMLIDMENPLYDRSHAFRQKVEQRLALNPNLI
jgi:hypothetical protein